MSGVQSTASDIDIDLGRLFSSLARNWLRILTVALAATALAFVIAWSATPHYQAETRILIETRESVFTRPESSGENERPILDEEGRDQPGRGDLVDRHTEAGRQEARSGQPA